jgi:hypothetical protein
MFAIPPDVSEGDLVHIERKPAASNWRVRELALYVAVNMGRRIARSLVEDVR